MEVRFAVVAPASQKRSVAVRLPILVGRSDEAKFRIKNDSVSRRHCEFFIKDDVVFVRDLGSTNGTLLGEEQIPPSVETAVPPGTVVHVGGVAFRVEYGSAAVPAPESPTGSDTLPLAGGPAPVAAETDGPEADGSPETAFAGMAAAEEPAAEGLAWPTEAREEEPPPDDENLNDFFKSLQ